MWMWDGMGGGMWWSWLFVVLLLVGVAVLVVVLVQALGSPRSDRGARRENPATPLRPTPREILDERYARGEIDANEYDERRRRLEGGPGGGAG